MSDCQNDVHDCTGLNGRCQCGLFTVAQGLWPKDDLRRAFVTGAKWWEFHSTKGTMWASDADLAEAEAENRYPNGALRGEDPTP